MDKITITALAGLMLVFAAYASAQDTATGQTDQQAVLLDEITVRGDRSFFAIRFQIREAEEDLYALFNELNSDDDFDISCRTIRITSSYIPRRACEPKFMSTARQANAIFSLADMRDGLNSTDAGTQGAEGIAASAWENGIMSIEDERELLEGQAHNLEALNEEMLRIAQENPEYLEALMRVEELKSEFTAMRQELFGDD